MAIEYTCKGCRKMLRVADDTAGREARCPECGTLQTVPATDESKTGSNVYPASPAAGELDFSFLGGEPATFSPPILQTDNPYQSPAAPIRPIRSGGGGLYGPQRPAASRGDRFAGAFIDGLIQFAVATPGLLVLLAWNAGTDESQAIGMLAIYGGLLILGVINWVMVVQRGQSIGKRVVGTQVVRNRSGELPGFGQGVVMRTWLPFFLAMIPGLGRVFGLIDALAIFGSEKRCLHDLMADTRVIYASGSKKAKPPATSDPGFPN